MIVRVLERAARRTARRLLLNARSIALHLTRWRRIDRTRGRLDGIEVIAAVRLDRLGDLVLTLPALDDLAASYPNARLVAFVRPALAPLLRGRASVSDVVEVPAAEGVPDLSSRISILGPELAVDFSAEADLLAAKALARAKVPARVGLAGGGREVFFTRAVRTSRMGDSIPEINARLVETAGGRSRSLQPSFTVSSHDDAKAERQLRGAGAWPGCLRIAVHPGGTYPTQRWPLDRLAETALALASQRDGQVVVIRGPGEEHLAERLRDLVGALAVEATPKDVVQLAAVLGRCDLLLANNSGPLHLAGAIGLPTVSTMGPTDPVRFWPWGPRQVVLRRENLPCSPCTRGRCRQHDCLRKIPAGEMVCAAESLLERPAERMPARVGRAGA